jgi:hypothetical protein
MFEQRPGALMQINKAEARAPGRSRLDELRAEPFGSD